MLSESLDQPSPSFAGRPGPGPLSHVYCVVSFMFDPVQQCLTLVCKYGPMSIRVDTPTACAYIRLPCPLFLHYGAEHRRCVS
eukprot:504139-Amphidinium_carterae.1